jgi:SM-20-related protein
MTIHSSSDFLLIDDFLPPLLAANLSNFIGNASWRFGATSGPKGYSYWFAHFAGIVDQKDANRGIPDASPQLREHFPILFEAWQALAALPEFDGHILTRCYANGYPYGYDGLVHRDANDLRHTTAIFYPHTVWDLNWAGETVLFCDEQPPEILFSAWPKPNRLFAFRGTLPHVARGISRMCPVMRTTLMFKTMKG